MELTIEAEAPETKNEISGNCKIWNEVIPKLSATPRQLWKVLKRTLSRFSQREALKWRITQMLNLPQYRPFCLISKNVHLLQVSYSWHGYDFFDSLSNHYVSLAGTVLVWYLRKEKHLGSAGFESVFSSSALTTQPWLLDKINCD